MPVHIKAAAPLPAAPSSTGRGVRIKALAADDPTPADRTVNGEVADDNSINPLLALLGGGALVGGAVLAHKPALLGKAAEALLSLRSQLMLSGLAIPKTVISNTGGAIIESLERGTAAPIRELASMQTLKDLVNEYKIGAPSHVQAVGTATGQAAHGPGRVIAAIDNATQHAMARAGLTADEAAALSFQTPLGKSIGPGIGDALDSPAARYLLPFRRTPFNQFVQGFNTMKPAALASNTNKAIMAGVAGAGAAHGAVTSDETFPATLGLGAAAANKYALPYLLAAAVGRQIAGGRDATSVMGEALPISEYGLGSGVTEPTKPYTDPAILRTIRRILGDQ